MPDKKDPKEEILWHQSGVSPTGKPFVQLLKNTEIICQMSPEQARDHARAITEAAEASEQDAFIMDFFQNKIGISFEELGSILVAFREYRAQTTGKSQGPTKLRDWVMPPKDKTPDYFTKKNPPKE